MKGKLAILVVIMIGILGGFGCQKKEFTKEELYEEFQKNISSMKSYTCKAEVKVFGNKSAQDYKFIHTYNKPDNYKIEILSPEHLQGKFIEYNKDKITVTNPNINDKVELSNSGENDQYLFIGDFIKNYFQAEDVEINLIDEKLILEIYIPGEDEHFNKQILYINA